MTDYCTPEDCYDALPDAVGRSTAQEATLERFITAASRYVDSYIGAGPSCVLPSGGIPEWFQAATSEARIYDGSGLVRLAVHHFEGTAVVSLPSGYTAPTFRAIPNTKGIVYLRATDSVGRLLEDNSAWWRSGTVWPMGIPVTVTAQFGYTTVPLDITRAAVDIITAWWRQRYAQMLPADKTWRGSVGIDWDIPPLARDILDTWRYANAIAGMAR